MVAFLMKKIIMVENQEFNSSVKIGAHHFAELFAENGYEVLWLSPALSPLHLLKQSSFIKERLTIFKEGKVEFKKNIYGYAPFTILPFINAPILKSKFIGENYLKTSIPSLKQSLSKIGFGEVDILWISNLKATAISDFVKYDKIVHRLSDEKSGFKNFYDALESMEIDLFKKSNFVFATASKLVEKAQKSREDVTYLPNGVKYNDFQKAGQKVPSEYTTIHKKCVYVGAVAEWLDMDLIKKLAKEFKEVDFYFIGPNHIGNGIDLFNNYDNLHYLGKKPYQELQSYLEFADIGIIPFIVDKLTDAINPVKLFEYMSCGLPTITTNFHEMSNISGPFKVGITHEDFSKKFSKLLKDSGDKISLKEFAKNNDWEARFKTILSSINKDS